MEDTDSKKRRVFGIRAGLLKDRTAKALFSAIVLSLIMGLFRPDKPIGMSASAYWAKKISWEHCADAVLTGDSRVLMALSPEIMEEYLDYKNVVNYGFGANWYCHEYMQATERLLDPEAPKKAIIMGFSAHTLTWRTKGMSNFTELSKSAPEDRFLDIYLGRLLDFYEPMSLRDLFQGIFPSMAPTQTVKDFKENGWIAVHKAPGDEDHEVKRYRGIFKKRQVSEKTVAIVMEYVSRWKDAGIKIYGFVPPTCEGMVELEKTASGFNKEQFVARFKEAGGIWLETDLTAYYSFDGSHLQDDGAIAFSHDLAKMIQKAETGSDKIACTD